MANKVTETPRNKPIALVLDGDTVNDLMAMKAAGAILMTTITVRRTVVPRSGVGGVELIAERGYVHSAGLEVCYGKQGRNNRPDPKNDCHG